ncbi:MAG: tyrosine-type recombinase/integrase, partial [Oscillospiraceae bacterium]|nr:tyrosine-type recombinase/integrase [Oscillospiraceae bacterium]
MSEQSETLSAKIEEYLEFRTSMGFSDCHRRDLEGYRLFCVERFSEAETLTSENVRAWVSTEAAKNGNCLRYKVAAIRGFAKYLSHGAYVLPNAYTSDKSSFAPYVFTDEGLAALFRAFDTAKTIDAFLQYTLPVLFRLIYTCGLRPREGRLAMREHFCLESGKILITNTKRRKERIVIMSDDMLNMCRRYDGKCDSVIGSREHFFVCGNGEPLSARQFGHHFNRCWQAANPSIPPDNVPNARPYDLRHRHASTVLQKWLDEGRNLNAMLPYLRACMGH